LYSFVKIFHISCVVVSLSGFTLRGILKLRGSEILQNRWLKILPHIVDTFLLVSAIILVVMSGMYPWLIPWVGVKLAALVAYIIVGAIFMHSKEQGLAQYSWFGLSLLIAGYIVMVALTKSATAGF
ncbi:MAG: SirB2 family protein, partial [Pseudohongiella sp.]|nr:SirB2 family protein [Pseudohongiella sp.]